MTTSTAPATEAPVEVKVGDFFVCSWGYDQTNVDFYKVVGLTKSGKSVRVQKWSQAHSGQETHFTSESVVAGGSPAMGAWVRTPEGYSQWDSSVEAPVMTKRLRLGGYKGASFSVNDYSSAYLWDGQAEYQTASGFGH